MERFHQVWQSEQFEDIRFIEKQVIGSKSFLAMPQQTLDFGRIYSGLRWRTVGKESDI